MMKKMRAPVNHMPTTEQYLESIDRSYASVMDGLASASQTSDYEEIIYELRFMLESLERMVYDKKGGIEGGRRGRTNARVGGGALPGEIYDTSSIPVTRVEPGTAAGLVGAVPPQPFSTGSVNTSMLSGTFPRDMVDKMLPNMTGGRRVRSGARRGAHRAGPKHS